MQRKKVDFPQPEGPKTTITSPFSTFNETFFKMVFSSNDFVIFFISSNDIFPPKKACGANLCFFFKLTLALEAPAKQSRSVA